MHRFARTRGVETENDCATTSPIRDLPILVKVWAGHARHDYRTVRRSLPSLLASDLPAAARIHLVDDASNDRRLPRLLADLARRDPRVEVWTNAERLGPDCGHVETFARLVELYPTADAYVCCDDDVVYHSGWLQRLLAVRREANARGIDGIYTALNTPFRAAYDEIALPTSRVLLKRRQPALNWLLPRSIYDRVGPFRATGIAFDSDYCDRTTALGIPVICLRPSWVQNIGYRGAYQNSDRVTADDFVGRLGFSLALRARAWALRRRAGEALAAARRRLGA